MTSKQLIISIDDQGNVTTGANFSKISKSEIRTLVTQIEAIKISLMQAYVDNPEAFMLRPCKKEDCNDNP